MTDPDVVQTLADHKYVRLTTFRRDGTPVPTTVWHAPDGDRLVVITDAATGKVKRIRHTPRVLITPSDARGRVTAGLPEVEATAEIVEDPADVQRVVNLIRARYGLAYQMVMLVHRLRRTPLHTRVGLRLTPTA